MNRSKTFVTCFFLLVTALPVMAGDSPQEQRHELMEGVGGGAKTIGKMLKGEAEFDAAEANAALATWSHAAANLGDLFPEGTESGYGTEAKETIWSDRAGFNEKIEQFAEKTDAAVAANPQDLESLKMAAGPVFKVCKSCHESYRIED